MRRLFLLVSLAIQSTICAGQLAINSLKTDSEQVNNGYILGIDDQLRIALLDVEGFEGKTFQINSRGELKLPLIGYVQAAGLTIRDLEKELTTQLKKFVLRPQLSITVSEYRSQPVSVIGAVNQPGIHYLRGSKTLVEVLSMAGGLRQDAGPVAKLTRRSEWGRIPLEKAVLTDGGKFSVAEIGIQPVLRSENPEDNVIIQPFDIISVGRSESVYIVGEVTHPGGIPLNERGTISVLQALSVSGGLTGTAKANQSRIIRNSTDGNGRIEVPVDVKAIIDGKIADVPLRGEDILFVPNSRTRKVALRTMEAIVQAATGIAIWRSGR